MFKKIDNLTLYDPVSSPSIDAFIVDDLESLEPRRLGGESGLSPVVLSAPHGGRYYPKTIENIANLDAMRTLEDVGTDIIIMPLINENQSAVIARCSRAVIDVSRPETAIDPKLNQQYRNKQVGVSDDGWKRYIQSGYGLLPRLSANRKPLYNHDLPESELDSRIDLWHRPFHKLIAEALTQANQNHSHPVLLDIHSMPPSSPRLPDIIIGDLNGQSCPPEITNTAIKEIQKFGLSVGENKPYAGGFITQHYCQKPYNAATLQIEINRDLYLQDNFQISSEAVRELGVVIGAIITAIAPLC